MDKQCSSCGGFCKQSGCERENVATNDTSQKRVDETGKNVHEPVAWRFQSPTGGWAYGKEPPIGSKYAVEPLYTHPASQTKEQQL